MKDVLKNPLLYYILIPVLVGCWPLILHSQYLPETQRELDKWKHNLTSGREVMLEILELDPQRLDYVEDRKKGDVFNYASALDKVARLCSISSANFTYSTGKMVVTSKDQKSQTANVNLQNVDIQQCTKFISTIQHQWPDLQCTYIRLTKKPDEKDKWDVKLDFKYFF
jgi:hypothetical protein